MYVQLFLIWEFNIGDKKNSIHYYCWTVLSAILKAAREVCRHTDIIRQ